jgi:hypothetical protein
VTTELLAPVLVPPAFCHIPVGDYTIGPEVADLSVQAGFGPDDHQRMILDGLFTRDARTGKSAASSAAIVACRQNIKTGTMKQAGLGWLFLDHCPEIVWTAHRWDAVTESFDDLVELIAGSRWLTRRIRKIDPTERAMSITTRRGGHMRFMTRTPGGGRAMSGQKILLDEAWAIHETHIGSLLPILSARSVTGDPQLVYGSSAAKSTSEVLHDLVARGRGACTDPAVSLAERRYLYCEFCAPPPEVTCDLGSKCTHDRNLRGCGCDKPEYLAMANPALHRRISLAFIQDTERRNMSPAEFGRERMGWHDPAEGQERPVQMTAWAALRDEASEPDGPVTLSVVYSRNRREAAVGLGGKRADGTWHVEIADVVTPSQVVERVGQIIARALDTDRPVCAVAVDKNGFESECIQGLLDLREVVLPEDVEEYGDETEPVEVRISTETSRDLEWAWGRDVVLVLMTGPDVATAYSGFVTSVTETKNLHHRGQAELDAAVEDAIPRDVGDAGQAWGRKKSSEAASSAEIHTLVAVTQARWVHERKAPLTRPEPQVYAL